MRFPVFVSFFAMVPVFFLSVFFFDLRPRLVRHLVSSEGLGRLPPVFRPLGSGRDFAGFVGPGVVKMSTVTGPCSLVSLLTVE